MAKIYQIPTPIPATVGVFPSQKFALFGDSLSTVTTAGYLNETDLQSSPMSNSDIVCAFYNYNVNTLSGDYSEFSVSIDGTGVITLTQIAQAGTGTVNSGTENELAYYDADGTAVSGLSTANSSVLVTSSLGVPSLSTTLPSGLAMQTPASIVLTNGTGLPVTGLSVGANSAMVVTSSAGVASATGSMTNLQVVGGITSGTPKPFTLTAGSGITIDQDNGASTLTFTSTGSGSGTVNSGTENELSYYAADGAAVSGLTTANSSVLVTSSLGVPSLSTTLPSGLALQTPASVVLTNATGLPVTGLSVGANSAMVVTNSSGVASATPAMTNLQFVGGITSGTPKPFTLTAGSGVTIDQDNGASTVTFSSSGSGTVNAGTENQLAYYAADGSEVSGLATANSSVLITSSLGVPSLSTTLPSGLDLQTPSSITLTNGTELPVAGLNVGANSAMIVTSAAGVASATSTMGDLQVVGGVTAGTPKPLTLTAGSGIGIVQDSGGSTITISGSGGGGLAWSEITGTSQAMVVGNGYIANNASLVTFTLPTSAAVGTIVAVQGSGAGGWIITQTEVAQTIRLNGGVTTAGTSGSIASGADYDVIYLICTIANAEWTYNSGFGNYVII